MASNQEFSLRWNNYFQHVTHVFDELRDEENLVDVTLCCEGRKLKAHKILLSACSGYFHEIFKENPCHHPVIIFQNVKYEDLEALVCFMYKGEVNVDQDGLSSFLSTAELLEVKGLIGSGTCNSESLAEDEQSKNNDIKSDKKSLQTKPGNKSFSPISKKRKGEKNSSVNEKLLNHSDLNLLGGDSEDGYEDPAKWMDSDQTQLDQLDISYSGEENPDKAANQIGKTSNDINNTQESLQAFAHGLWRRLHPSLKRFGCDDCGKVFKHPRSLDHHKKMHEGRTTCPLCSRVFGRMYALRLHISSSHPGQLHILQSTKSH